MCFLPSAPTARRKARGSAGSRRSSGQPPCAVSVRLRRLDPRPPDSVSKSSSRFEVFRRTGQFPLHPPPRRVHCMRDSRSTSQVFRWTAYRAGFCEMCAEGTRKRGDATWTQSRPTSSALQPRLAPGAGWWTPNSGRVRRKLSGTAGRSGHRLVHETGRGPVHPTPNPGPTGPESEPRGTERLTATHCPRACPQDRDPKEKAPPLSGGGASLG